MIQTAIKDLRAAHSAAAKEAKTALRKLDKAVTNEERDNLSDVAYVAERKVTKIEKLAAALIHDLAAL